MECFSKIAAHMLKGLMYHRDMEDYLRFLGFEDLAWQQRMRYLDESTNFACIHKQYLELTGKLLHFDTPQYDPIIPASWYNYTTANVDNSTRQKYLKSIFEIWHNWEQETVTLYEQTIKECRTAGNERAALILEKYLKDVACELHDLETLWTEFEMAEWQPCKILLLQKE